jgi:hypothetical protein
VLLLTEKLRLEQELWEIGLCAVRILVQSVDQRMDLGHFGPFLLRKYGTCLVLVKCLYLTSTKKSTHKRVS